MNIAILGTGTVGRTLAAKLVEKGHRVMLGTRDPASKQKSAPQGQGSSFSEWHANNPGVKLGTMAQAAQHGQVLINATSGSGSLEALQAAGEERLAGKIIIDIANPLDFSRGMPPTLLVGNDDSLGERIQKAFPRARVVKTLNTVTASLMVDPRSLAGGDHDLFVCGNDAAARADVAGYLRDWFGWKKVTDLGDITNARGMEAYLLLWVRMYGQLKTAHFNLKIVT